MSEKDTASSQRPRSPRVPVEFALDVEGTDAGGKSFQVKAKATAIPSGSTAAYVAKGQADMAIQLLAELHAVPGVQIFPFPAAVQNFLKFQGSVSPASKHKKTGASFLKFLSTPAAVKMLRAKYMEPGN